jgi:hypothetical protein
VRQDRVVRIRRLYTTWPLKCFCGRKYDREQFGLHLSYRAHQYRWGWLHIRECDCGVVTLTARTRGP